MSITGSIAGALGLTPARKVRYAVVGLGDIAQGAMLPAVAHTGNSEIAALVTGDPEKARALGARYGVPATYCYEQFGAMLRSGAVDAIYLATPNWRHAEFAVPALQAGIHVLVEKPLEVSPVRCRAILDAARASRAKVMVAYRLHFEPATLAVLDRVRAGRLGDVLAFTSTFSQRLSPDNHRARNGVAAGPVFDLGPYPVNAARAIFGAEPTEVVAAVGSRSPDSGLGDFDHTVAATLRFPGDRLAQLVVSYVGHAHDAYTVLGTEGRLTADPGYLFGRPLELVTVLGGEREHERFEATDQFGGELKYFSDCILADRDPEPDAEEGYADLRVLDGIVRALESGGSVTLEPFTRETRIDTRAQEQRLRPVASPPRVDASAPAR
ncbi:Gfo/Idh/MocA family protein [Methylobacterium platani]|uniref:Glucose-fructose oxidoreductase n=2 Tax=Methylobacterium platani TaxID=427683 RepID=A0A179S1F5_9HYPH|nr:Gfo/Idh/MocA family oxidoreductase [Methylobacterium platani]KMO21734.1 glucose-fructose oxidoreductase [Methylobacterium platani JCM 14648]OAS19188.1 glucose-fructose oxidoreductase [Methylobacterium platani]